ncbi:upstream activation factor subunit spp27 isoform X1 [Pieris rapae]|uniref:upstream activation factor subunit spp27 isoform X1 n=1 Tax=Pieris rapae TaxID=64459 RepID=UPI000B9298F1|nr:upstream activation factor subunit spp27 isoform X1 [Pieris rapae]
MADVSDENLQKEILKILEKANLAKTSTKKVRQKLEEVFDTDLTDKKELIDQYVMDYVNKMDSENSDSAEEESDEKKKPAPKKRKKRKGSDSDSDWVKKKPKKQAAAGAGRGKGSGYTRAYKLSPALAELMGQEEMPRHEVVKRVWTIIKEKNLYDPSNKQYAICDEALYKVIGTKRFRTFGMMKYLKTHFLD